VKPTIIFSLMGKNETRKKKKKNGVFIKSGGGSVVVGNTSSIVSLIFCVVFFSLFSSSLCKQPMVEVVAPAALSENYQFPATAAGRTFMVSVPKGGVKAGQRFSIPLPPQEECIQPRVQVPVGHWKDGFWDLFSYGFFHPTVLNSCCCTTSKWCTVVSTTVVVDCGTWILYHPFG
jgi:hypothetical protein